MSRKEAQTRFVLSTNLGVLGAPDSKYDNPNHKNFSPMHMPWVNPALSDGTPLLEAVKQFKPNVLLGLSTAAGIFDERIIRAMADINERPIIMPMSNPTSRAECKDLFSLSLFLVCSPAGEQALLLRHIGFPTGEPLSPQARRLIRSTLAGARCIRRNPTICLSFRESDSQHPCLA